MRYASPSDLIAKGSAKLANGPLALIFAEDEPELESSLRHHLNLGFRAVVALMPADFALDDDLATRVLRVDHDVTAHGHIDAVNTIAAGVRPGTWIFYCFNAEYLFFPFCESRTVGEMLLFHTEERRDAMLTFVIDVYAGDLGQYPDATAPGDAYLDKSGYYALARLDPMNHNHPKERQMDFFGGLRWRYEQHIPANRRNIDRIAIFRSKKGVMLCDNHVFSDEEYNTFACPWHNNLTAAIVSFRTAKALTRNPGSAFDIQSFKWHNSAPFEWHSHQLLDLGLMEPGQWF